MQEILRCVYYMITVGTKGGDGEGEGEMIGQLAVN